ncbi:MAG: Ig-like domain repeat protein, partial [Akkermansiaceae bacterium]|nr:Ig-like domain repeat protein [Akkermansiaceae bacterium]
MKSTEMRINPIKHLARALVLGVGLGAATAQAQVILEVGGAGTIGDTTLTTAKVPAAGVNWTAAGGEGIKYSSLTSPTFTVPATHVNGEMVTLKFTHRYNFEDAWDGGEIFVNVNGAGETYVDETAFSQNGYTANNLVGSVWTGGEWAFNSATTDWFTEALIETIATVGPVNQGDTIAITFKGGWDDGYNQATDPTTPYGGPGPAWEIGTFQLSDASSAVFSSIDFMADSSAGFTAVSDPGLAGPWTYLKPTSVFEINADTLTADRYAPNVVGSVIDLSGADIAVVRLTGTLDAGDTFTLFNLTGGTSLTGTPGTLSLPPGTWNTSNLLVNGTIVCVLPLPPFTAPTPPPVTAGMIVWVSGDGVDASDPAQVRVAGADTFVTQWKDFSTNNHHATNATANDQPRYIASGLNGKPVLRFGQDNDDDGDRLYLGDLSADFPTAGSVFVVSTIDNDGRYNLFGNCGNDERWVADTWDEARPGSFRQGRSESANFTRSDWPTTGSHVFALESSSSTFEVLIDGDSIGTDTPAYNSGSGQNWTIGNRATNGQQLRGDIAELILFNRILTPLEANKVGGYLVQKYGLTTTYPPLYLTATLTRPADTQAYPTGTSIVASTEVAAGSVGGGTAPYTVEFWVDNVSAGTATTSDPYTLDLGPLANGPHEIYAKVTDSSTPTPVTATSATHAFTVAPAVATTTTLASSANPSIYGGATVTATVVANNSSTLTGGTVQFYDGVDVLGDPVAVDTATGKASYSLNLLEVGPHAITADYSGHGVYAASSALALSQVVNKMPLTVTASNVFRPTGTANPDPLPYKIAGYQNGETLGSSGVTGDPLLTTAANLASTAGDYAITCALGSLDAANYSFTLVSGTLTVAEVPNTFSVNFYVGPDWPYGGLTTDEEKANVKLDPYVAAGLGDWYTNGWLNFLVPWAPTSPQTPVTLTSNHGSLATFKFNDCRNGWTYAGVRTTLLGDGNGNMMDGHVNSTLQNDGDPNLFDMEVSEIPFAIYDVIFYMGANQDQFGDGTGVIEFNGGAERAFTLKSGAFDGTFTELVDATTPGNYIVFKGVTGSSFTTRTWGLGTGAIPGFNHLGPFGFQIRAAAADYDTWAGKYQSADLSDPAADYDGDGVNNDDERLFGLDPTSGASVNPISVPLDAAAGT